ncbi:MAG: ferredoxin [Candidatus Moraniibacteriota bacterium]|nr:MAG: ferredoxin [Candidatus Moranbacteria bacterium]
MPEVQDIAKPHGPITLKNGWTVEVDKNICIGAGPCVGVAPKTFELDDEAKAVILSSCNEDDADTILNAARSCPVSAITIKNDKGEVVFPN